MRRTPRVLLILLAGCADDGESNGPADTLLAIDVQVSDGSLLLYAREPERPCECSFGWTEVGACRAQSDAIGCACDPWPASCLEEVAVLGGGEPIASSAWDANWWGVFLGLDTGDADQLVISGCGVEVSVPLPAAPRPTAIVEVDDAGLMTWTSDPAAATSLVTHGDGFGGESCHQEGGEGELQTSIGVDLFLSVSALAKVELAATELGTVRIWSGNRSELTLE